MDVNENALVRQLFQNKIFKSDGQSLEEVFVDIKKYKIK